MASQLRLASWALAMVAFALGLAHAEALAPPQERAPHLVGPLAPGLWMHVSYREVRPWGLIRSNGLVVAHGEREALLVDTAWDDAQTEAVLQLIREDLGRAVVAAVSTHAHEDKMGGMQALRAAGVRTFAHPAANAIAPSRGLTPAEFDLALDEEGNADALAPLAIYFPGAGHTASNLVVHVPGTDVLFGGCLIRPGGTGSLGNTRDGNVATWGASVRAVAERFPEASTVIPSHGPPGGRDLLSNTIGLAAAAVAEGD